MYRICILMIVCEAWWSSSLAQGAGDHFITTIACILAVCYGKMNPGTHSADWPADNGSIAQGNRKSGIINERFPEGSQGQHKYITSMTLGW